MPRSYGVDSGNPDDVPSGVSPSWWTVGASGSGSGSGAHHRGGLPNQGDLYGPEDFADPKGKQRKKKKPKKGKPGRGQQMSRRARKPPKPKPVRVKPAPGGGNAGKPTEPYPTASQSTGGAIPLRELDALSEVGLTPLLAELVNHGTVSLSTTLSAWQREQDRITNRTWRRPAGCTVRQVYRSVGEIVGVWDGATQ